MNEYKTQLLTDVVELQHRFYSEWEDYASEPGNIHCKFCGYTQYSPAKEVHSETCARLKYLAHFYGVRAHRTTNPKYKHWVAFGKEATRAGVWGWWTNADECMALVRQAIEKEKENKNG